jgi:hypothetical protein
MSAVQQNILRDRLVASTPHIGLSEIVVSRPRGEERSGTDPKWMQGSQLHRVHGGLRSEQGEERRRGAVHTLAL